MNTAKHKYWLLLALLIFVGQVVAAPFSSCQMKMDSTQSSMHNMHDEMPDMDMSPDMSMDHHMNMPCCGDKCDCSDGICMGVVMMIAPLIEMQYSQSNLYTVSISSFKITQASSAIFHPPILS